MPGFTLERTDAIGDELAAALAESLGPALAQIQAVHAMVTIRYGTLGLRVDGFRSDPADLDQLVRVAGLLADALAARCTLLHEPDPLAFSEPLADFDSTTHPEG